jgi:hypothetical protein
MEGVAGTIKVVIDRGGGGTSSRSGRAAEVADSGPTLQAGAASEAEAEAAMAP